MSYSSVLSHMRKAEDSTVTRLTFPFTERMTNAYTVNLISQGLRANTIWNYLVDIHRVHVVRGHCPQHLMPVLPGKLIRGRENLPTRYGTGNVESDKKAQAKHKEDELTSHLRKFSPPKQLQTHIKIS